jgi:NAD(P)-dependent dehydrogenase (short-subunit alcohol dehydrogenase family)
MSDANTTPHVVITGAAGALGRAVAQHFLEQGARLALGRPPRADRLAKSFRGWTIRSICCSQAT